MDNQHSEMKPEPEPEPANGANGKRDKPQIAEHRGSEICDMELLSTVSTSGFRIWI
jgi:hypothetical protein